MSFYSCRTAVSQSLHKGSLSSTNLTKYFPLKVMTVSRETHYYCNRCNVFISVSPGIPEMMFSQKSGMWLLAWKWKGLTVKWGQRRATAYIHQWPTFIMRWRTSVATACAIQNPSVHLSVIWTGLHMIWSSSIPALGFNLPTNNRKRKSDVHKRHFLVTSRYVKRWSENI